MKKVLYSIICLFALIGFGFSSYLVYDIFFDPMSYWEEELLGRSMEQYGFADGGKIWIYPKQECHPGDNCSITCLVDKCKCPGDVCLIDNSEGRYLKRLISVEDGCYWFEGNPEPFIEDGIEYPSSFDSRDYGCLMPHEFEMQGVTTPANIPFKRTL